jgi:hypothetical protein
MQVSGQVLVLREGDYPKRESKNMLRSEADS